jgi:hypothetical protein
VRCGDPKPADLAILVPRPEVSPVTLALYLLSNIPFGILIPVDLLDEVYSVNLHPNSPLVLIREKFDVAGKLSILAIQMVWIIGNVPDCAPVEIFSSAIQSHTPIPGSSTVTDPMTFEQQVPETIEDWIQAQEDDPSFAESLHDIMQHSANDGSSSCA